MKNLWNKVSGNKKLLWGCVGGVVCVCVLVGVILLGGGNGGQGDASTGGAQLGGNTTESTQQPATDAQPTESTGAEETEPIGESTAPVEPTEATEPAPTETEPEPSTEPSTEPEETLAPTEDPNTKPTESETFDFSDVKIEDLTYEEWDSWSWKKQDAFISDYKGGMTEWTFEEKHEFKCMQNNNYDCGYEGHWCRNAGEHAEAMARIAMGCEHCGKHDCVSLFVLDQWGGMSYDHTLCPEYDVKEDETMYCKECGLPTIAGGKIGEECCQYAFIADYECSHCGELIHYGEHHHCIRKH